MENPSCVVFGRAIPGIATVAFAADASKWQAEWQKTIEAAKKEAQVSLYGGQEITHPDIVAAFHKEFPLIKVTTTSGRGGDLVARITAVKVRRFGLGKLR